MRRGWNGVITSCVFGAALWPWLHWIQLDTCQYDSSAVLGTFFSCTCSAPGDNPHAGAAGSTAGARSQSWANFAHSLELMRPMAAETTAQIKPHWWHYSIHNSIRIPASWTINARVHTNIQTYIGVIESVIVFFVFFLLFFCFFKSLFFWFFFRLKKNTRFTGVSLYSRHHNSIPSDGSF